jgi:hypothetical protein
MLREALKNMGRADLIGSGKNCLIPAWQPLDKTPPRVVARKPLPAGKKIAQAKTFRRSR